MPPPFAQTSDPTAGVTPPDNATDAGVDYTGAGLTQDELTSLFGAHDPQGQAKKPGGRPYMSAIGVRVKDENGQDQSGIKYTLWDGTHFTAVPQTQDAQGNNLPKPVYSISDTGTAFKPGPSTAKIPPAGQVRVVSKDIGGGLYRLTEISDGYGNWNEDPNKPPQLLGKTPQQTHQENADATQSGRASATENHYAALDERYTHAFEMQSYALQLSNQLRDKEINLTNAVSQNQLSLQQAQFQYSQLWNQVVAAQNQAKMELDALSQEQQAANQVAQTGAEQRGQDIAAQTASQTREAETARSGLTFAGQMGQTAAQTATGSLPFIAPVGTSALMAKNREALASGNQVGDQTVAPMAFPFNPATIGKDAADAALKQLGPWIQDYFKNGPQGQQLPDRVAPDYANTPMAAALAAGQFQAPTMPGRVTPGTVSPPQPLVIPAPNFTTQFDQYGRPLTPQGPALGPGGMPASTVGQPPIG